MTRTRPLSILAAAVAIPLSALAIAACGGSSGAATAAAPKTSSGASATVGVAQTNTLGSVLVNSQGHTLYLFAADVSTKSECTGACATAWPPLLVSGKPSAGSGVTASELGTITRSGGARQVTYHGHPLYLFVKDQKPGDITGQGVTAFGAAWFALTPAGSQALGTAASQPASGGSSGY